MDTNKLKNGKYYHGQFLKTKKTKGWFIGSFLEENNYCKTDKLEVLYQEHDKGDIIESHFHKLKVELLIMIDGKAKYTINNKEVILRKGDYLFIDTNNIIFGKFIKPSIIFVIHSLSIPNDKYLIKNVN